MIKVVLVFSMLLMGCEMRVNRCMRLCTKTSEVEEHGKLHRVQSSQFVIKNAYDQILLWADFESGACVCQSEEKKNE